MVSLKAPTVFSESDHLPTCQKEFEGEQVLKGVSNPRARDHQGRRGELKVANFAVIPNLTNNVMLWLNMKKSNNNHLSCHSFFRAITKSDSDFLQHLHIRQLQGEQAHSRDILVKIGTRKVKSMGSLVKLVVALSCQTLGSCIVKIESLLALSSG